MIDKMIPDIDGALRAICRTGAIPSTREEYETAREHAHPYWVHFSWFVDGKTLYWQGNGDSGGDQTKYYKKQLSPEEESTLPDNFFLRRIGPIPHNISLGLPPDTQEDLDRRARIIRDAWLKALEESPEHDTGSPSE